MSPLDLSDDEAVRIIILPPEPVDKREETIRIMMKGGLMRTSRPSSLSLPPDPVSEKERIEIAKRLGKAKGKPLSEIIISERSQ